MPMTEAQKRACSRWVEKNKDRYAEQQRRLALKYYYDHKETITEKKKAYYQNKREAILAKKKIEYQNKKAEKTEPVLEANFVTE